VITARDPPLGCGMSPGGGLGGRHASASSARIQDGGSPTWPASRAEAVTSLQAQVQWSSASLVVGQPQMVQV
jgi:hypothetical protein